MNLLHTTKVIARQLPDESETSPELIRGHAISSITDAKFVLRQLCEK